MPDARRRRAPGLATAAAMGAIAIVLLAGCGGGGGDAGGSAGLPPAGAGGVLSYAVPGLPTTLDPLAASTRADQVIVRQLYEPLIGSLTPPYGADESRPGLALSAHPSRDRRVWTLILRSGVRFQDGTPFNAAAVLTNSRRWRTLPAGRELLPELFAVDAPRPDEVRFLLDSSVADLPRRLADARLGIVSPRGLQPETGEGARLVGAAPRTGTGPFELGLRSDTRLVLTRDASWWGAGAGLGPALGSVAFIRAPADKDRLRMLKAGRVEVAEPLRAGALGAVSSDPLLMTIPLGGGNGIGVEASVRGLGSSVQSLSGVWLTRVMP